MSAQFWELADLVARWIHVIAGIMWVGNSMLFNWLDRNLRPRREDDVYGDIWLLHSGGFYIVEKNKGERAPSGALRLPTPLHWFKWQAYTTWITGALLLVIVYYAGGRALLVDPSVHDISQTHGVALAVFGIVLSWAAYETTWRTIGRRWPTIAGVVSLLLFVGIVLAFTNHLPGRAAWIHIGALLGTIMAGNVVFTIMPSQRDLVGSLEAGRAPSQEIADRAKTRSIHNNYITFPVIVLMVSSHFPSLYAGKGGVINLFILAAGGALVRHFLNIRFTYPSWRAALGTTIAITVGLLVMTLGVGPFELKPHPYGGRFAEPDSASAKIPAVIQFSDARRIIDRRCAACHSIAPSDVSLGVTPAGVAFDTPEQIAALAQRIRERAVTTRTMPPGNKTRITDAEREILARWIEAGAIVK